MIRWLLVASLALISGCPSPRAFEPVSRTMVVRRGVRIEGTGFALESGGAQPTPFVGHCWDDRLAPVAEGEVAERYAEGIAAGARPVRVQVPGRERPLFGLLLFCDALNYSYGPASRIHTIDLPLEDIAELHGGAVLAVYERADWMRPVLINRGYWAEWQWNERWWYGWVLWLSDEEL